ncbi:nuclear transport factor 2 family protein [Pseudofrankia inefficax]|uniref:SnoaL-like domain-containing protein n=1 Tax=Pseudofrankia inefficax (strain DSM 45817 / CECT 9037 / DDB 130130 / EuI1c) TaxID=298654 RepID=E3IVD7_PSEI1|nr:nuclear transport factor 2 family protein [Pseudofrankia inefficax]ADP81301.1 hypothetical protein FraEuI1c_3289 [Pseudofrankia inefficax]
MSSTQEGRALMSLVELQAREAIRRLISLYGQLLDDLRLEEWGHLFTEDAIWRIPLVTFEGRAAIVEGVGAMEPAEPGRTKHLSLDPVIDFESATRARVWTDQIALQCPAETWTVVAAGRYYDVVEFDGTAWRFVSREADVRWPPGSAGLAGLVPVPAR